MLAPLSPAEVERLRALVDYSLLDTPPEPEFEPIVALAAKLFKAPIALVSLVDKDRLWFKSCHGLSVGEVPREMPFCSYTILTDGPLVVLDALLDERFAHDPMVTGPPYVRFYAGAPLITRKGMKLGALCVVDTVPRAFSEGDEATLTQLASIVMAAVEACLTERRLLQEIAVHEQTTQALQLVEAKYQRIAENSPGMVYRFVRRADGGAEFLFVSDGCREILGLEPALLLRDAGEYFKLIHPEDVPLREQAAAEAVAALKTHRWEGRHILPSGETRWIQTSSRPDRAANGDIFWDGVLLDITARKRSEDRLLMLESSVEHANDAVLITEAEPVDGFGPRILYVNKAFTNATGYTSQEVLGKTPRILQGPNTSEETKTIIRRALKRWKPVRVELVNYRKDGSEFWEELNIVPVANEKGWYTHWVSVQRDISARKQIEQTLTQAALDSQQAREEADRANAAKSEFLSRMSHELRTPLNAILGFGQLLEMSKPTPKQQESIAHILSGGRHLLDLINEVLDISRIEAGHLELTFEPVRVAPALEEVAALLRPLAARRNIVLNVGQAASALEGASVQVDRQRLKQILLNLLSNAIKYNRPAGRVDLTCERTEIDGHMRLNVRDTGPGMSPEDLTKLFVPFERLSAKEGAIEGTGIGLAISKRLVEAMRGTLKVKSTLGEGSTFSLELPLSAGVIQVDNERGAAGVILAAEPAFEPRKQTVLYFEDNVSNLTLIEAVFSDRNDLELLSAMDGRSGLEMARAHRPDLILLDMHLPDLMGDAVLRALKDDERTQEIPVVMVSADATPTQIQRLLTLGATAYLTKPFNIAVFLRTLDETLALPR